MSNHITNSRNISMVSKLSFWNPVEIGTSILVSGAGLQFEVRKKKQWAGYWSYKKKRSSRKPILKGCTFSTWGRECSGKRIWLQGGWGRGCIQGFRTLPRARTLNARCIVEFFNFKVWKYFSKIVGRSLTSTNCGGARGCQLSNVVPSLVGQ